jgi:hypothetical protein
MLQHNRVESFTPLGGLLWIFIQVGRKQGWVEEAFVHACQYSENTAK